MENADVNPEADAKASKKPSRMKVVFAVIVVLVLILGGVYYLVFDQLEEGPPTLGAADQSLYQGLIQTGQYGFLQFDEEDIANWVNPDPEGNALQLEYANSKEGLHYVASSTETTFQEILDGMNPSETSGELMIAVYDDGFFMTPNDFYVTGEGVPLTIVPTEEMHMTTIEPNRFIVLASDKDIELWGDFYTVETLQGNFDFCDQRAEGWFPGAFSGNVVDEFSVDVEGVSIECMPDQLWALNENTLEFEEQDLTSLTTLDTFIWTKYNMAPFDSIAAKLIEMEDEEGEVVGEPPVEQPPAEQPPAEEPPAEEPEAEEPEGCNTEEDDLCDEATTTCVINSIFNTGTGVCECDAGYELSVAGTSCELEELPAEEPEITTLAPITDLTSYGETSTRIILYWTTPEDEELYSYDVRISLNEITEGNWEDAKEITDIVPYLDEIAPGDIRTHVNINDLSPGTSYYFAVKVLDKAETEKESDISNVYQASTTGEEVEEPLVEVEEPLVIEPLVIEPLLVEPAGEEETIEFEYSFSPLTIVIPTATDCGNTDPAYKCITDGSDPAVFIETGGSVCATFWKECVGVEYSCHNLDLYGQSSEPDWIGLEDPYGANCFKTDGNLPNDCAFRAECVSP